MEKGKETILVPHDFTIIGDYALENALVISQVMENEIVMVHIVASRSEIDSAKKKCEEIAEKFFKEHFVKPKYIVREGSIFADIGKIASEANANLVVMGTHGIKGVQKLTGSKALKVIVSSSVPFIIVQGPPAFKKFEKIVFPIDFRVENKEKNAWVSYLANYYQTKFYFLKQDVRDKSFKAKVQSNTLFARKYFDSKNIEYEIHTAPGKKKFSRETIDFAKQMGADLILVVTTRDISLADYAFGAEEQQIIANDQRIPVMVANPNPDLKRRGGFSAMGG
jgi:nucleotide-binding universal stress UspA family protein